VPDLICPLCGRPIAPSGPGVASYHPDHDPERGWKSFWVPFIEDLRTNPLRLVHPACFADAEGVDALVSLVHANDEKVRRDQYLRWRKDQGLD
jgi:hypothetical protein